VADARDAEALFESLLRRLHALIAAGQGDSDEADALRDEMDAPWYAMTEEARERMGELSARLYREGGG
jgi:Spy/CpxP family protein refolding chaperone